MRPPLSNRSKVLGLWPLIALVLALGAQPVRAETGVEAELLAFVLETEAEQLAESAAALVATHGAQLPLLLEGDELVLRQAAAFLLLWSTSPEAARALLALPLIEVSPEALRPDGAALALLLRLRWMPLDDRYAYLSALHRQPCESLCTLAATLWPQWPQDEERAQWVVYLLLWTIPRHGELFAQALQDPSPLVRERAVTAAAWHPEPEALLPGLSLALADPDPAVRGAAIRAVGWLGAGGLAPQLEVLLEAPAVDPLDLFLALVRTYGAAATPWNVLHRTLQRESGAARIMAWRIVSARLSQSEPARDSDAGPQAFFNVDE